MTTKQHNLCVNIHDDAISFTIDDSGHGADEYRLLGRKLLDYAQATLRNAKERGDCSGDRPDTFADSVAGSDILTQLARELLGAADAFEETKAATP